MDGLGTPPDESQDPLAPSPDSQGDEPYDKDKTYWPLWKGKDLSSVLDDKQLAYFESARNRGLITMWIVAYAALHGLTPEDLRDFATQQISFYGDELELLRFHINLFRSYLRNQTTMALGESPAFKAMVTNSDHQSQAKAELADRIVTSLHKRYYAKLDQEVALGEGAFGLGGTHTRWDFGEGDDISVDVPIDIPMPDGTTQQHVQKQQQKSGAPVVTLIYPWTLVTETRIVGGEHDWCLVRELDSRWNLIAQWPHLQDDILQVTNSPDKYDFGQLFRLQEIEYATKDLVTVKHFYHRRCAAVPQGRYVIMAGDVMLWDGPCPRSSGFPVAICQSGTFVGTAFGYADSWDLIAVQQAINQLNSDALRNYATFGRQSIAIEKGTEITIDAIANGDAFYVPPGAQLPKAVMTVAIPDALHTHLNYLHKQLDTVSFQNAASRGDPDPNVRSGEMNALLDSIAIRAQSFRQQAVRNYRIECAEILVDMIDRYGESPFLVEIAGIESRSYVAEYTRDDLSGVQRITMDVVSPMSQSMAGRLQTFTVLAQLPAEDRVAAHEYLTTGNTSLWMRTDRNTEMMIRRENEDLITGERPVTPVAGEDVQRHYQKHWAQLEQLMASDNPDRDALARIQKHLLDTIQTWLGSSPIVNAVRGVMSAPPLPPGPANPDGNPTWQLQAATSGGMAGIGPSGPGGPGGGGPPPHGTGHSNAKPPQAASGAQAQVQDSGSGSGQVHPSGTPLPKPSTPPGQS